MYPSIYAIPQFIKGPLPNNGVKNCPISAADPVLLPTTPTDIVPQTKKIIVKFMFLIIFSVSRPENGKKLIMTGTIKQRYIPNPCHLCVNHKINIKNRTIAPLISFFSSLPSCLYSSAKYFLLNLLVYSISGLKKRIVIISSKMAHGKNMTL